MNHETAINVFNNLTWRAVGDDESNLTLFGLLVMSRDLPTSLNTSIDIENEQQRKYKKHREVVADFLREWANAIDGRHYV